jgi:hypothetical protein
MISIYCEGSAGPGASWLIKVEFRPLSRGFSVWVYEDNLNVDRPKWRKAGLSPKPLNWQAAGAYLIKKKSLRVFGDFWGAVEIRGIPKWASTVICCLFIEDEDAAYGYRAIGEFLTGLGDKEVRLLLEEIGPIPADANRDEDPEALMALEDVATSVRGLGLSGKTFLQIKASLGVDSEATLEELAFAAGKKYAHRRVEKFLSKKKKAQASSAGAEGNQGSNSESWVELSSGDLPEDISLRVALVECWLSESTKPVGGRSAGGIHLSGSDWPVLKWILGNEVRMHSLLKRFAAERPVQAAMLVEEVMKRGKQDAHYFEEPNAFGGWVANSMGRPIKRSSVQTALAVQAIADSFKIPIDEKHRIGELPYLK